MTVEPDVVRRKLLEIDETTAHLRSWAPVTIEQLERSQQLRWAVERGLQIAAEALSILVRMSSRPSGAQPARHGQAVVGAGRSTAGR